MINISVLASSSSGNCYLVSDGKTKILLECGIRFVTIQQELNFKTSDIVGCLITHEHGDHAKDAKAILNAGIDIYTSKGTAAALDINHHRLNTVAHKSVFKVGTFDVVAFSTEHDAAEPLGYLLYSNVTAERLLFITDSYYVRWRFPACEYMMLECNYSANIVADNVETGRLPIQMVHRLMHSHMSLETLKDFIRAQNKQKLKAIFLIHLSDGNSDEGLFKKEITALTGVPVTVAKK